MTKTDNKVTTAVQKLVKSLSETYEQLLPGSGDDAFFVDLDKLDVGMTKRLARRPLTNMEVDTVTKSAAKKFNSMCMRCIISPPFAVSYMPTKGGEMMLRNLIELAERYPDTYCARLERLKMWKEHGHASKPDIQPLTLPLHFIVDDEDGQQSDHSSSEAGEVPF